MGFDCERRRVLLIAGDEGRKALGNLFASELAEEWELLEAECFREARFMLQHEECDLLLVDQEAYEQEAPAALPWLAVQRRAPLLLLADLNPDRIAMALDDGVAHWLPRGLALEHPGLLAAALRQAANHADLRRQVRNTGEALADCRRQVNRLVGMLWETTPAESPQRWFGQRYMMDRLEEELTRADRHRTPLAIVLGELDAESFDSSPREAQSLSSWTAERICSAKRRHDVAGQYGPHGFMLLLGHTTEPGAIMCCRRLQTVLEHSSRPSSWGLGPVRVHFGVASYSENTATPQSLLGRAEERLDQARHAGAVLALLPG
jgi:diguanylate cyclase (GGDEF)-like protein